MTLPWVSVGLAWGGAMLSKYHAIFLPAGTLLLLVGHRPMRHWLAKPGPYVAIVLGLLDSTTQPPQFDEVEDPAGLAVL